MANMRFHLAKNLHQKYTEQLSTRSQHRQHSHFSELLANLVIPSFRTFDCLGNIQLGLFVLTLQQFVHFARLHRIYDCLTNLFLKKLQKEKYEYTSNIGRRISALLECLWQFVKQMNGCSGAPQTKQSKISFRTWFPTEFLPMQKFTHFLRHTEANNHTEEKSWVY